MKEWGDTVREEKLSIDGLRADCGKGQVEEVFGDGTAAVISPVGVLNYRGNVQTINNNEIGPVCDELYKGITDIQWGRAEDTFGWTVPVAAKEDADK